MTLEEAPHVAVERCFHALQGVNLVSVLVQWMVPQPDGQDFFCDYVIRWPDQDHSHGRAYGIDGLQALQLAQTKVALELYGASPPVYWLEPGDRLGLHLTPWLRHLENNRNPSWEENSV